MIKNALLHIALLLLFIGVFILGQYIGSERTKAEISKAPAEQVTIYKDFKMSEWKCEDTGHEWDLLQPTGYWINHTFNCWKKEMELEEYCFKFECSSDWYKNYYAELKSRNK